MGSRETPDRPRQPYTEAGQRLARQSMSQPVTIDQILDIEDEAAALASESSAPAGGLDRPGETVTVQPVAAARLTTAAHADQGADRDG